MKSLERTRNKKKEYNKSIEKKIEKVKLNKKNE